MELFNLDGVPSKMTEMRGKNPWRVYVRTCWRCGGAGGFEGWPGFTCFRCGGSGKDPTRGEERLYDAEQLVKAQARSLAAKARSQAKREAAAAAAQARFEQLAVDANALADEIGTQAAIDQLQGNDWQEGVRSMLATLYRRAAAERQAAFEAKKAAERAVSQHVGAVGERRDWVLTVQHVHSYSIDSFRGYGSETRHISICRDADGNVVIYKGSYALGAKGEVVMLKASVKEHGERDGVKQTVIQRPKISAVVGA